MAGVPGKIHDNCHQATWSQLNTNLKHQHSIAVGIAAAPSILDPKLCACHEQHPKKSQPETNTGISSNLELIEIQTVDFSSTVWGTSSACPIGTPFSVRPISSAKVECGTQFLDVRGVVSSNILSTCSRERPLVSGTRK